MSSTKRAIILGTSRVRISEHLLEAAHGLGVDHLDTAYNYGGFRALDRLAALQAASVFKITSKVGFFQSPGSTAAHSLSPARLYPAVEDTVARLGVPLDTILLHNPEHAIRTLQDLSCWLEPASHALQLAVRDGLARRWGLSIWNPGPLLKYLHGFNLKPDVLMTRVGLSVSPSEMVAIDECRDTLAWPGIEYRGMAPLGGAASSRLLHATDLTSFVLDQATNMQAAVRVSFELPSVNLIALGTSNPAHLRDAVEACVLDIDNEQATAYRDLIHDLAQLGELLD